MSADVIITNSLASLFIQRRLGLGLVNYKESALLERVFRYQRNPFPTIRTELHAAVPPRDYDDDILAPAQLKQP